MNATRFSGYYLIATGVIHNTLGLVMGWDILAGMHQDGWWNTIEAGGQINFARSAIAWFLLVGFFWMLLGYLMQQWVRHSNRPLPASLGWGMLAAGVSVAIVLPVSGAWLFIPQGLLILWPHRPVMKGLAGEAH
ncbi:DUF6463 family protein [Marinimicrobium sp. ABcell2]|uniref:DUF6463 family protein n=1 Tax=Marinimicrobium sp. ABcell2 TaxID=3069751 RepID=UPI0027ADCB91|nr:DUF6463 family protein [Marinimicrobium sp. ABcell2]MDQ2078381.1 DUF6463 family protein [Marinimicrobium sp. ABcell2]